MQGKDSQTAQQLQRQIAADSAAITSQVTEIAALTLPGDTAAIRTAYGQAALAVTTFAAKSVASPPRSDAQLQTDGAALRKAWIDASDSIDPIIRARIVSIEAVSC